MTPEITKHCQAHADCQTKREKMKLMSGFLGIPTAPLAPLLKAEPIEPDRERLVEPAKTMSCQGPRLPAVSRRRMILKIRAYEEARKQHA